MGQGMCVSSRLPPGEDVDLSPDDYKPPAGVSRKHSKDTSLNPRSHHHGSKKKMKVRKTLCLYILSLLFIKIYSNHKSIDHKLKVEIPFCNVLRLQHI